MDSVRIYRLDRSGSATIHVGAKVMTLQATTTMDIREPFSIMPTPVPVVNPPTTTTDIWEPFHLVQDSLPEKIDVILLRSERGTATAFKWCRRPSKAARLHAMGCLFRFIVPEEQLDLPGDTGSSTRTSLWQRPESDTKIWRGIFSPPHRREVLFSKTVELRTADLPKWKPHITIDRRTRTRAEDE